MLNYKFCPRCGTSNPVSNVYCIKCGYAFRRAKRKGSMKIILLIAILILGWIGYRIFTNQPIIPTGLPNFFQNATSNITG